MMGRDDRFDYKSIDQGQRIDINKIKENAYDLLDAIENNCPNSREKALALTKLEECVMWASKSISHG